MEERPSEAVTATTSSADIVQDVEKAELGQAPAMGDTAVAIPDVPLEKLDSRVQEKKKADADPFEHLEEHEAAILRRQLDIPSVKPTFFSLYRYATRNDLIILGISSFSAIAAGAALPLMYVDVSFAGGKADC